MNAPEVRVPEISASPTPNAPADVPDAAVALLGAVVQTDSAAPVRAPPVAPRGPVTWDEVADSERSSVACRADKECVVETEIPPCVCCGHPRVFAIHVRERKAGAPTPYPPCTPACATGELPCRAPPAGPARDVFRARCDAARCRLERR